MIKWKPVLRLTAAPWSTLVSSRSAAEAEGSGGSCSTFVSSCRWANENFGCGSGRNYQCHGPIPTNSKDGCVAWYGHCKLRVSRHHCHSTKVWGHH